jgi:hypothetical protein
MQSNKPFLQSFVRELLRLISTIDPSVSNGPIIMEAFRSITTDQLKSLASSLSPDQLRSLLGGVPADHLEQLMASLPAEVLQPVKVPAEPASLTNHASATILQQSSCGGFLTDRYDPPRASSPFDNQNVAFGLTVDQLNATIGVSEDDAQPFPIYGWLNVAWERIPGTSI